MIEALAGATPVDQYVDVKGVTTRYWTGGATGSPILLIHGIGAYVEFWLPSFEALAREHPVYALDLIGHGKTAKPSDASYDLAALAQFVHDFMGTMGIEHAHLVGHSLGGAVATRLAIMHPETADRLVLVASAGLGKECHPMFRLMGVRLVGELLTRPSRSGVAKFLRLGMWDESRIGEEFIDVGYHMSCLPGAQKAFLRTLRDNGRPLRGISRSFYQPNIKGLSSFSNPVLVVWGREDKIIPVAHTEVAAQAMAHATIKLFDHCGHVPMFEYPEEFNALLLDFLKD
jgi:4,5:9,10-diseco-3-hydroxy-5,9,17-trioxoandrosta-1(10),2-diene-4-oate hydrolase